MVTYEIHEQEKGQTVRCNSISIKRLKQISTAGKCCYSYFKTEHSLVSSNSMIL